MSRWAVAVLSAVLVLTSGCASAGGASTSNPAIAPQVSKRAWEWEGPRYSAPDLGHACDSVRELSAGHPAVPGPPRGPAVRVAPDCSPLDPEPFRPGPASAPAVGRV